MLAKINEMSLGRIRSSNGYVNSDFDIESYIRYSDRLDRESVKIIENGKEYLSPRAVCLYICDYLGYAEKTKILLGRFSNFLTRLDGISYEKAKSLLFSSSFISRVKDMVLSIINNIDEINSIFNKAFSEIEKYNGVNKYTSDNDIDFCSARLYLMLKNVFSQSDLSVFSLNNSYDSTGEKLYGKKLYLSLTSTPRSLLFLSSNSSSDSDLIVRSGGVADYGMLLREFNDLAKGANLKKRNSYLSRSIVDYEFYSFLCDFNSPKEFRCKTELRYSVVLSITSRENEEPYLNLSCNLSTSTTY